MLTLRRFTQAADAPAPGPAVHFACSAPYLEFRRTELGDELWLAEDDDGAMTAVRVYAARWFKLGQVLAPPWTLGTPPDAARELAFSENLVSELRRQGVVDLLIQPPTYCVFQASPAGSASCPFGSYTLALRGRTDDELLAGMHADHRHRIRSAARHGAEVRIGPDQLGAFYELHSATMAREGMPCEPRSFFETMAGHLGPQAMTCAVAYHQGMAMGGIVVLHTAASAFYLYGGSHPHVAPPGAVRLLHWEVIRQLRDAGVARYDFAGARLSDVEGTKQERLQRFKARFGGELVGGCLWKCDVRPARAAAFRLLTGALRRLRGERAGTPDVIGQELNKQAAPRDEHEEDEP